jgi:hypothetical protein
VSFLKKLTATWLPLVVAFLIGALFMGSASGHSGTPGLLHSGHSDTMNGTLTAQNFKYASPRTVRYVVPGSAFVAANPGEEPDHANYSGEVEVPLAEAVVAAVNLPHGAVVTRVTAWHSTTEGSDFELHLESNIPADDHDDMVVLEPVACATPPCQTTTADVEFNPINNNGRSYGIWFQNQGLEPLSLYRVVVVYRTSFLGPVSASLVGAGPSGPGSGSNG